jgi:deoxyribose-phosphate aldolase
MTDQQLDDLVARIGDELLTRLGIAEPPPPAHACACAAEPQAAPSQTELQGWIPDRIGLDCRDSRHTPAEIGARCLQARTLELGAVSVFPSHVVAAGRILRRTGVRIVAGVGWPHGATSTAAKALEAELALGQGADEIEVVVPSGALLAGEDDLVFGELKFIADMTHRAAKTVTAVIDILALGQDRLIAACALSRLAGADAVCAGRGLSVHGAADAEAVRLFRKIVGQDMGVHAAGGIVSEAAALNLAAAGADRVTVEFLPNVRRQAGRS